MKYALFVVLFPIMFLGSLQAHFVVDCPDDLRGMINDNLAEHDNHESNQVTKGLRNHLVNKGFTFAQVKATKVGSKYLISVTTGEMGKASFQGNQSLSDEGLLSYLNWKSGEPFNYGKFQSSAARLNANRFVKVDAKLAPTRGEDGEILVDAAFTVEDSTPIAFSLGFSNDGSSQSSGWRGKAGIELWEPFGETDKLLFSYASDPEDFSQYNSYAMQYLFGSEGFSQVLYAGYSQSEYDNVISSSDINVAGDGYHIGFSASYLLGNNSVSDLALTFGITYLDTANRIDFYGTPYGEENLSLFLPRLGLRGSFDTFSDRGKAFWSVGITSDWGTSDNDELAAQRAGVQNGFMISEISLTNYEPFDVGVITGGFQTKMHWQHADEPLPVTLQKSLGGMNTIRGYEEREAFGDRGFSINFEYRFDAVSSSFLGMDGRFQKLLFYDYGHLSSQGSIASDFKSLDLSSFGVGLLGNLSANTDLSLQLGVPLSGTPTTEESQPRAHFGLNLRF